MRTSILLAILLMGTPFVSASPTERDQELAAAKQRLHALLQEAKELHRLGKQDQAEAKEREAHALRERLARAMKGRDADKLEHLLDGLERGIESLRALGKHEEAERLERTANELRQKLEARRRDRRPDEADRRERETVKRRLQAMRFAFEALMRAEKREAAEVMEHAIHAQELALEGRRDPEAIEVRKTAPKLGQQTELLFFAAKLLAEQGKAEQAEVVERLGREMKQRLMHEKQRRAAAEHPKQDMHAMHQRMVERVERLEQQVRRLSEALERMQDHREHRGRDRDDDRDIDLYHDRD